MPSPQVHPVACWADNYAYVVCGDGYTTVIDPTDAAPVLARLAQLGRIATEVLLTHHHPDHVAGVPALLEELGPLPIWGSAYDLDRGRLPTGARGVPDGGSIQLGSTTVRALSVPAHTLGAVAWVWESGPCFTGDTLFAAGCGRLFEGSPAQLEAALYDVLSGLSSEQEFWCGHEYTVANLRFASSLLPEDASIREALGGMILRREAGLPTVPTTLGWERQHNLFLRCDETAVRQAVGAPAEADRTAVLAMLRGMKDTFRTP